MYLTLHLSRCVPQLKLPPDPSGVLSVALHVFLQNLCSVFKVQSPTSIEVRYEISTPVEISYPASIRCLVGPSGLEPPTLRLSVVRSSQLSYGPSSSQSPLAPFPAPPLGSAENFPRSLAPPLKFQTLRWFEICLWAFLYELPPEVRRPKRSRREPCRRGNSFAPRMLNLSRAPAKAQLLWVGGDSRDRTGDLLLARQALSQLSYIPTSPRLRRAPSKLNNVTPVFHHTSDLGHYGRASALSKSP